MKRLPALSFIVLLAVFAQVLFAEPSLQQVSRALSRNKVTRGEFSLERYSAKNGRALKSSGNFTIASDYGMIWFTQKPVKTTQAFAKDFVTTENSHGKRTKADGAENKIYLQMSALTRGLFTGNLQEAGQNADMSFSFERGNDTDEEYSWKIEFFPKDDSIKAVLAKITVTGRNSGGVCVADSMQMAFTDRSTTTYCLSGHHFSDTLTDEETSFFE